MNACMSSVLVKCCVCEEPGDWVFNGESYVRIPPEWHMECLCQKLEQLCLWLESKVDCLCQLKHGIGMQAVVLKGCISQYTISLYCRDASLNILGWRVHLSIH